MKHKYADTKVPIHDIIAKRWSSRAFDPEQSISDDDIIALAEAARWAPSSYGVQPWRFLILNKSLNETSWNKALSCINEWNRSWAKHAPLFVVAVAHCQFSHNQKLNRWAEYDTGAAVENFCLQATALNITTRQIGGFDLDQICQAFDIPDNFTPMSIIAAGYLAKPDNLSTSMADDEQAPRTRNPLEEHFYSGEWGKGLK